MADQFRLRDMVQYDESGMAKVDLVSSPRMMCGMNCFTPGQWQKAHTHSGADKLYYVVEGTGEFMLGAERVELSEGGMLHVPADVEHGVVNHGPDNLAVFVVISPNPKA